jgi:hypothetical protein
MVFNNNPNIIILEKASQAIEPIINDVVFVGGCATGLLITDPAAPSIRVTLDVDVLTEVYSIRQYHVISDQLRSLGFSEDFRPNAPICRWTLKDIVLDVMPTNPEILGFGNQWFKPAFSASEWTKLPSGKDIRILPAPYFLATKFEAFDGRGENDFLLSKDIEDIIAIIDGRPEIVVEVQYAKKNLNTYLKNRLTSILDNRNFKEALPGHLPPDSASQGRLGLILDRITQIIGD